MESNHKRFVNFPVCNKEICIQQDWHVTSACTKDCYYHNFIAFAANWCGY